MVIHNKQTIIIFTTFDFVSFIFPLPFFTSIYLLDEPQLERLQKCCFRGWMAEFITTPVHWRNKFRHPTQSMRDIRVFPKIK